MGNLILFCSLFVSTVLNLESSVRFPARGFAKVLTEASAQKRLSAYRSSLLDEANGSRYHEGYSMQFQLRPGVEMKLLKLAFLVEHSWGAELPEFLLLVTQKKRVRRIIFC